MADVNSAAPPSGASSAATRPDEAPPDATRPDATRLTATGSTPTAPASTSRERDRRVIWLLVVASFVVLLNETTMSVALRQIMASLNVDARTGQWLATAFMLTMAVVIPITGFLLQRFNTRPIFIAAMTFFCSGTLLAAVSPVFGVLLVARVIQASGTAIMLPLLMTTLMTLVAPEERGRMMGNVSMVISVAPAAGPMLAGALLDLAGWRGIFWFMLPIGVVMLFVGARLVTNVSEPQRVPIDVWSVVLSALGFGGLVYGLSRVGAGEGAAASSNTAIMVGCLVVGALGVLLFALRQTRLQRRDAALLDLRIFRFPQFTIALATMAMMMASLFGLVIVLPIYLQDVLKVSPVTVGFLLLPGGLLMGLLAQLVGRLYDRSGPRVLVLPATILATLVMFSLSRLTEHTSLWLILAAHVSLSIALAFVFTPLFTSSLAAVPPHLYSHASAALGTLQQVAGAAGTALFITIMAARTSSLAEAGQAHVQAAAGGTRAAFLAGAVLSLVPVALAFGLRKVPPPQDGQDETPAQGLADPPPTDTGEPEPAIDRA